MKKIAIIALALTSIAAAVTYSWQLKQPFVMVSAQPGDMVLYQAAAGGDPVVIYTAPSLPVGTSTMTIRVMIGGAAY